MSKSLYNERKTVRGDNILHKITSSEHHIDEKENIDKKEISEHSSKRGSVIAPSNPVSSQSVISRFIEQNGDHVQSIHAEPVLLVANKVANKISQKSQNNHKIENMIQHLPSGHRVECMMGEEKIHIYDPDEKLQVSITLTKRGPLVQLEGAKIQMKSASDIDVHCDNLRVHTNEDLHLNASGELTIESTEELHINCEMDIRMMGKVIWLN